MYTEEPGWRVCAVRTAEQMLTPKNSPCDNLFLHLVARKNDKMLKHIPLPTAMTPGKQRELKIRSYSIHEITDNTNQCRPTKFTLSGTKADATVPSWELPSASTSVDCNASDVITMQLLQPTLHRMITTAPAILEQVATAASGLTQAEWKRRLIYMGCRSVLHILVWEHLTEQAIRIATQQRYIPVQNISMPFYLFVLHK